MPNYHLTSAQKIEREELKALGQRRCTKCGEVRSLSEFGIKRHRPFLTLQGHCNPCKAAEAKVGRTLTTVGEARLEQIALRKKGQSRCTGPCGQVLPFSEFYLFVSKRGRQSVVPVCKACISEAKRKAKFDRPKAKAMRENKRLAPLGLKLCPRCATPALIGKRSSYCRSCERQRDTSRRANWTDERHAHNLSYLRSYNKRVRTLRKLEAGLAQLHNFAQQHKHEK